MKLLPKNPITMCGTIDQCWLFAYQMPEETASRFLPPQLEAVTHNGCAFWNVVVCKVRAMRPLFVPESLGITYWHVAYRIYVRFRTASGTSIEGLYFLRSDCDNPLLSAAGNLLTDFKLHPAKVRTSDAPDSLSIEVLSRDMPASVTISKAQQPELAAYSSFSSLDEAAEFLKYKPSGISIASDGAVNAVHIRRDESQWKSKLMRVIEDRWSFFTDKPAKLEVCYQVQPIDYVWHRGKVYR